MNGGYWNSRVITSESFVTVPRLMTYSDPSSFPSDITLTHLTANESILVRADLGGMCSVSNGIIKSLTHTKTLVLLPLALKKASRRAHTPESTFPLAEATSGR